MTTLIPLADRVVVQPLKEDEMSPGGIFIPETAQPRPVRGRVVSVGPKALDAPAVNSIVVFAKYAGVSVKVGGVDLLLLKADDLLAVE